MKKETARLAVLFTDVCGSTKLYESLGDRKAQRFVGTLLARLEDVAHERRGTVIKSLGDELMCTFPSASDAVDAAIGMHRAADAVRPPRDSEIGPVNLHAGLQFGDVVWENDDVYGSAVNVAARVVALAKPRQVLTTASTVEELRPEHRENARALYRTVLRGTTEAVDLHEIQWELMAATSLSDSLALKQLVAAKKSGIELVLELGRSRLVLDALHPGVSLGRLPHNDLAVPGDLVSRYHARIEHRRGNFVLIDQSANGTFLTPKGGATVALLGEEALLAGTGTIGLGQADRPSSRTAIRYEVRAAGSPSPA